MKKLTILITTFFILLTIIYPINSKAEDVIKIVGEVTKIEVASDGNSAVIEIKDNKTGKVVEVYVYDEETLTKFKTYKIREGDEVRCRYEVKDGKNVSKSLLRTKGC